MNASLIFVRTTLGASLLLAAAATAQADFTANFNGALTNSGGGTTYTFAGSDYQEPIVAPILPVINLVNEGPGDDAMNAIGSIPTSPGFGYNYFGFTTELTPGQAGTLNLRTNSNLSFRIKANTPTAYKKYLIRIEDSNGGAEFNNTSFFIPDLTTSYQDVSIPLTFFEGGAQPVTLSIAKNITIAMYGNSPDGNPLEIDVTVDDLVVDGPALPPDPLSLPITSFKIDFNDQGFVSPLGGVLNAEWGYGNPFFGGNPTSSFVEITPGNYAWDITGDLVNGGDGFSYAVWYARMNANIGTGRDFSQATAVKLDFRKNAGDNLTWRVRLEDTVTPEYLTDSYTLPAPGPTFTTYTIPITEFTDGSDGTPVNLTSVRTISVVTDAGSNGVTPTLMPRITIDNVEFIFPVTTANGDANNDGNVDVADVTAIHNFIGGIVTPLAGDGDVDNDTDVDATDASLLVGFLVNGTPLP